MNPSPIAVPPTADQRLAPDTGARFRLLTIALIAAMAVTALVVVGSSSAAAAHDGHDGTETAITTGTPTRTGTMTSQDGSREQASRTLVARETIERLHLATINDVEIGVFDRGRTTGDLIQVPGRGQANPLNVDCYVDFDDDLTLQYHIPDGAENTWMTNHWYQKCFDSSYPSVAVKYMNNGHFHLGYEDASIGPCAGSFTDWGRKGSTPPSDSDAFTEWVAADCVSDIDPVTEPRSHISAHAPGHEGKILAYDGDGYLPFQLRTFEVVEGEVEVCHLPPGPIVVANGGGSPWQCTTWGEGYWNLSNHVPNAIEVRFEFLTNGSVDNIGIDLL